MTVIGPNGAGKTTLLAAIMGLLPSRGAISYEGALLAAGDVEQRVAKGVALVPEKRELFGSDERRRQSRARRLSALPRARQNANRDAAPRCTSVSRALESAVRSSQARCREASGRCLRSAGR